MKGVVFLMKKFIVFLLLSCLAIGGRVKEINNRTDLRGVIHDCLLDGHDFLVHAI